MSGLTVELAPGAVLQLWPQRAAFDRALHTLFIADAHIGKARSFRRLGVPVPGGTTDDALGRLDELIAATGARHIVFLGDLLHSEHSLAAGTLAAVRAWRAQHAGVAMTLVRGNHDTRAGDPPPDLGITAVDGPLRLGPWALLHEPAVVPGAYSLAGHVHPGVVLGGRAHDRLRLPCFHCGAVGAVLPAFGGFTGLHVLPRGAGERAFAVTGDAVIEVPLAPPGRGRRADAHVRR